MPFRPRNHRAMRSQERAQRAQPGSLLTVAEHRDEHRCCAASCLVNVRRIWLPMHLSTCIVRDGGSFLLICYCTTSDACIKTRSRHSLGLLDVGRGRISHLQLKAMQVGCMPGVCPHNWPWDLTVSRPRRQSCIARSTRKAKSKQRTSSVALTKSTNGMAVGWEVRLGVLVFL